MDNHESCLPFVLSVDLSEHWVGELSTRASGASTTAHAPAMDTWMRTHSVPCGTGISRLPVAAFFGGFFPFPMPFTKRPRPASKRFSRSFRTCFKDPAFAIARVDKLLSTESFLL